MTTILVWQEKETHDRLDRNLVIVSLSVKGQMIGIHLDIVATTESVQIGYCIVRVD